MRYEGERYLFIGEVFDHGFETRVGNAHGRPGPAGDTFLDFDPGEFFGFAEEDYEASFVGGVWLCGARSSFLWIRYTKRGKLGPFRETF